MWVQILCGLVIYKICKKLFYDDDVLDVETSDSNAIFSVAARFNFSLVNKIPFLYETWNSKVVSCFFRMIILFDSFFLNFYKICRLEKLYKGKAYVGLRIPDPDTGSRQNIDIVLITKGYIFLSFFSRLYLFWFIRLFPLFVLLIKYLTFWRNELNLTISPYSDDLNDLNTLEQKK